jgi:hypothetical protein
MIRRWWLAVVAVAGLLGGLASACSDPTEPVRELRFVRFSEAEPAVAVVDSFYAVKGDNRRLELRHRQPDGGEGAHFLRFDVHGDALHRYPDGRLFAEGDSVLIRVVIDPNGLFVFTFSPSGLEFSASRPAELRIRYADADDAVVGGIDEDRLSIWRRHAPADPWVQLLSVKDLSLKELRADVFGFTSFALASN